MEKLKVKNAIISNQGKESDNFKQFLDITKRKKIKVIMVKAGDKIQVDENCLITILFPEEDLINANILNNNSIVAKFLYKTSDMRKFSILLTGDIEEIAERRLVQKYQLNKIKDVNELKADILKVAHHRFKNIFNRRIFKVSKS